MREGEEDAIREASLEAAYEDRQNIDLHVNPDTNATPRALPIPAHPAARRSSGKKSFI